MIERIRTIVAGRGFRKLFWSLLSRGSSTILSFALLFAASHASDKYREGSRAP